MRMLSASWRCVRTISLALCMVAAIPGAALAVGPGLEMEVGGPGNGQGKLGYITDLTFDSKNSLYVLDGARWDAKTKTVQGNLLVQKFDNGGKFLSQFSIGQGRNEKNLPSRIAVDSSGDVYITVSSADHVERYDAQGTLKATYPADGATGITTWLRDGKEYVAVLGGVRRNVPGKTIQVGGDQIVVIDPAAGLAQPVKLEEPLANVGDLASGPDGNLYALAGLTIRKIDPQGKIIERIGSSPNFDLKSTRAGDGSEPLHTVAVDSKGQIYSWSTGNPGELLRYSSDLKKVTLRGGQYKFADYWSPNAVYTPVAIDKNDKVWLGIPDSGGTAGPGKHTRGWVLRVRPDFIDRGETFDARMMGLRPRIDVPVPYSIVYEPKQPVPFELTLPAANRLINALTIRYAAYDMYKNAIGNGQIDVKLTNGEAVKIPFTITPPAFGWYTVECQLINGSDVLTTLGEHIGVTPKYEGMVALAEGESKGGWEDVPRQMFVGLSNVRLHPGPQADASLEAAQKYGATAFMQITSSPKDLTPEFVRPLFEKFKGRVKYWEVINEPNFSISPEKLAEVYAWLYPMLKEIDPEAKVMGPAVCGVILPYHEAFFKAGGAKYLDVLSVHDYEGHESVDLYHWQWKFAALRKMMADYGIGDREIWQTERVLTGVRGNVSLFGTQAIRTTFHRDMLETLGIPPQHNNHYYLNDGGYKSVPSYIWSANGPHPAALALRTRYGLTLGQKYQGTLDFGPGGNDVFMGLRYANDQYSTLVLRNMGTQDQDLTLDVRGGSQSVTIYDAFGNASTQPVNNGKLTLKIGQMPTYVRLGAKQQAAVVVEDYGRNIASAATITYSGPYQGDFGWLVNNVMETVHSGYHWGGTGGPFIWRAPLTTPQTMEIRFEQPRTIDRLQMFGTRADNNWCALREYDVEYFDGTKWVTIEQVRIQIPETSAAKTAGAAANTWHQDNNLYVHHFAPVKTDRLRVRFIRTTLGFFPDGATRPADSHMPQYVFLREIRVFSPRQPVELAAVASPSRARCARIVSQLSCV